MNFFKILKIWVSRAHVYAANTIFLAFVETPLASIVENVVRAKIDLTLSLALNSINFFKANKFENVTKVNHRFLAFILFLGSIINMSNFC